MPRKKSRSKRKGHSKSSSSNTSSSSNVPIRENRILSKSQQSTLYYFAGAFALIFLFCAFFIYLPTIRRSLGFADNSVDPAVLRGYRARLRKIYERYNPNKLDEIEDILVKYRGREKELFKALHKKYVIPNRKVKDKRDKERKEKKRKKRRMEDDDYIPDDETEEEAAARRRRKKERDREKRKEERRKERGGKDYYEDWDDDETDRSEGKQKYSKYFDGNDDDIYYGHDLPQYEGEIELVDEN